MKKKNLILIGAMCLVLAIAGGIYFAVTNGTEGLKTVTLEVVIGEEVDTYTVRTHGEHVVDMLDDLEKDKQGFSYLAKTDTFGKYLKTVNGYTAEDAYCEYFAIYVNGTYASFGISEQPLSDGDKITVKLEQYILE